MSESSDQALQSLGAKIRSSLESSRRSGLKVNDPCVACAPDLSKIGDALEYWHQRTQWALAWIWTGVAVGTSILVLTLLEICLPDSGAAALFFLVITFPSMIMMLILHWIFSSRIDKQWPVSSGKRPEYDWLEGARFRVFLDTGQGGEIRQRLHVHEFPRSTRESDLLDTLLLVSGCTYPKSQDRQAEGMPFLTLALPRGFFRPPGLRVKNYQRSRDCRIGYMIGGRIQDSLSVLDLTATTITLMELDGRVKEWPLTSVAGLLWAYSEHGSISGLLPVDCKSIEAAEQDSETA